MKKEIYKEKLELKEVSIENDVPFSKISCPSCKEQVTSDHVDLAKAVAKCGSCHVVFPIQDTLASLQSSTEEKQEPLLQPKGVDVFEFKNQLDITVNDNNSWVDWVMILPTVIAPFFFIAIFIKAIQGSLSFMLPALGLLLIAAIFYYWFSVRKRHKILFNINRNTLDIEHRPTYLRKHKSFDKDTIEQIYVQPHTYKLMIIINDHGERKHIPIFSSYYPGKLKYLEKTLEKHLGIEDVKYA